MDDNYDDNEIEYSEPVYDDDYNEYTIPEGEDLGKNYEGLYSETYSESYEQGGDIDYTHFSEEQEFMDEYGVFDRAGFGGKIDIRKANPYEKLKKYISIAADILNTEANIPVRNDILEDISKVIENVIRPEDINPMGFLLGFIVSNGGNSITKDSFNKISKKLPNLGKHEINPPDLLRYGRYWITLNKKQIK